MGSMSPETEVLQLVLNQPSFQGTLCVLIMLYACLVAHAATVLGRHVRGRVMSPPFQLVLCLTTAAALRLACFVGFYALWACGDRELPSSPSGAAGLEYYAKSVVLLFDLPDFIVVSTYGLLLVVWFEGFLEARSHWLDPRSYRRNWRVVYLCFNVLLYGSQTLLYAAVFFDSWRVDGVRLLYLALAVVAVALPVAHAVVYVVLSFRFAGFPMAPRGAARRDHLSRVLVCWGVGRCLWGGAVGLVVFEEGFADVLRDTPQVGTVAIVGLFLVTEICPFLLALDTGLLAVVGGPRPPAAAPRSAYSAVDATPPATPPRRVRSDPAPDVEEELDSPTTRRKQRAW